MRRHLKKVRKSRITREELIADAVFLSVPALLSFFLTLFFDIHQSFYEWPFSLKFIFRSPFPYLIFITIGTITGFFIIKLLLFGISEENSK